MALESVLVALGTADDDRIERIIRTVVDIAGPADADVILAHVFSKEEFDGLVEQMDFDSGGVPPDDVARRHATVRNASKALDDAEIEYVIRGGVGDKGQRIVELAEDADVDLVVVGGRRRTPTGKAVFGSTAQEILLESPAPVTFVRSD